MVLPVHQLHPSVCAQYQEPSELVLNLALPPGTADLK